LDNVYYYVNIQSVDSDYKDVRDSLCRGESSDNGIKEAAG